MVNIFNQVKIPAYFDSFFISKDLWQTIYDNLHDENDNILRRDLENALTNNINGEYIY